MLTPAQSRVLDFIRSCIADRGFPPTRLEILAEFNYASVNAAQDHLRALERKGVIKIHRGIARGIQVLEPT
jgi:repressor LexA